MGAASARRIRRRLRVREPHQHRADRRQHHVVAGRGIVLLRDEFAHHLRGRVRAATALEVVRTFVTSGVLGAIVNTTVLVIAAKFMRPDRPRRWLQDELAQSGLDATAPWDGSYSPKIAAKSPIRQSSPTTILSMATTVAPLLMKTRSPSTREPFLAAPTSIGIVLERRNKRPHVIDPAV